MDLLQLILILGFLASATLAFVWLALQLQAIRGGSPKNNNTASQFEAAEHDVEHIFNTEFREELRNRGRLHFEKIIGENAMFLQQDLRLTTSQLNEYMKQEITRTLQEEFSKYEKSITDAKQLAIDSISKTQAAIEQQRLILGEQLDKQVADEKARLLGRFKEDMAEIVNHYVLAAIGNQIDLNDQLEYIISEMNEHKQEILEDITHGT